MPKKSPFLLETQRPGMPVTRLPFASRDAMGSAIARLVKSHFVGTIEPMELQQGFYVPDEESIKLLSVDQSTERSMAFEHASTLFAQLAKVKTQDLDEEQLTQIQEAIDIITNLCFGADKEIANIFPVSISTANLPENEIEEIAWKSVQDDCVSFSQKKAQIDSGVSAVINYIDSMEVEEYPR